MLIFKIYKILSFEYSYSSKFNAIHYFDSKCDYEYNYIGIRGNVNHRV